MNMTQHVTLVVEYLFTFSWLNIVYSGLSCNYALGGFKTVIVQLGKLSELGGIDYWKTAEIARYLMDSYLL